jgi:Na+-driven multidrug efflux pump
VLTVAGNLVNALLDAIFIFPLGLGVSGAALATVTSEYVELTVRLYNKFTFSFNCSLFTYLNIFYKFS